MAGVDAELVLLVRAMRWESEGVLSVTLEDPGGELPAWEPGAHIDVELPGLTRQFSLCGDPADRTSYRIAVLHEPESRGGSQYVHTGLRPGDQVTVRGPRNHFALEPAERYLFVAGGIGITPILPMVAGAEAQGAEWALAYGGRSRSSLAFLGELAEYGDRVSVLPQDECGLLDLDGLLADLPAGTAVYCCGPGGLLDAVEARSAGWPEGALHLERFRAKEFVAEGDDQPFELVCESSGVTVTVPPGESAVDVLEEAGVFVSSACREGICGTCEVKVLDGVPDHRDWVLSPADQESGNTVLLCVSRARGDRLVVDA
ncbi:PDR/VanB family oxidoreductase [Nonomuraea glycinis]|uniref:Ferredoxin n=1 Tax=Nonomuraea glycinis TaxID=2047744 RepID=A0A918AAV2_9ACTN|nr:PDR/VanB family oxidoreductase [Nonomuraea glycinis]MCA2181256.1 PDR/VanB family oxidoreductase [Nonomuraea glycinis]GGP13345.1 ferredoxin [Nonomuraea glycinis]